MRRNDLDFALAPERDGLLPVHDLERLVGGVQKERLLHNGFAYIVPVTVEAVKVTSL